MVYSCMSPHLHLYSTFLKVSLATSLRIMHILLCLSRICSYHGTLSKLRQGIVTKPLPPPSLFSLHSLISQDAINLHVSLNRLSLNYALRNHFLKYAKHCSNPSRGGYKGGRGGGVRCIALHCTPHCDKGSFRKLSGYAASFQRASPRLICTRRRRSHAGS